MVKEKNKGSASPPKLYAKNQRGIGIKHASKEKERESTQIFCKLSERYNVAIRNHDLGPDSTPSESQN